MSLYHSHHDHDTGDVVTHSHDSGDQDHFHTHHHGEFLIWTPEPYRATHSDDFRGIPVRPSAIIPEEGDR